MEFSQEDLSQGAVAPWVGRKRGAFQIKKSVATCHSTRKPKQICNSTEAEMRTRMLYLQILDVPKSSSVFSQVEPLQAHIEPRQLGPELGLALGLIALSFIIEL